MCTKTICGAELRTYSKCSAQRLQCVRPGTAFNPLTLPVERADPARHGDGKRTRGDEPKVKLEREHLAEIDESNSITLVEIDARIARLPHVRKQF